MISAEPMIIERGQGLMPCYRQTYKQQPEKENAQWKAPRFSNDYYSIYALYFLSIMMKRYQLFNKFYDF
jgi:hypothetical protein